MFRGKPHAPPVVEKVAVGSHHIPLLLVHHSRARRYRLQLLPGGTARVTIPRGGSASAARKFAQGNAPWLEKQLQRLARHPLKPVCWEVGTEILFRGEKVRIEAGEHDCVHFSGGTIKVGNPAANLRPIIEHHLRKLAARELPLRLAELARRHGLIVRRTTVRNQRTRWGSCSRRGTISLNWRLIQTPEFVRDYICLHELAHLLELNHSKRFWRQVERLCPNYREAELWLKQNPGLLH